MSAMPPRGRLYLVPAPLDHGCDVQVPLADVLPAGTIAQAAALTHWVAENAKSTRALLKRIDAVQPLAQPIQAQHIAELPRDVHKKGDHQPAGGWDARPLLAPALQGHDMGLVSEAGMPAVADPGSSVVRAAHALGIEVVPLVGPVSLLLALAASGLNGQDFAFMGYLPQDGAERARQIQDMARAVQKSGQTRILIETPYRNQALLAALVAGLEPGLRLAVATGLTLPNARTRSATVADWRRGGMTVENKVPAVFLVGRG
ncbi:SAM-dependent methyltransferase [Ottowia sp. SB7-C50]|uniref:SAM-dependent methyltransferase n=1 Tax=Ottowia sp. SB7-C50 TaxID=3081231 RepID=UPI002953F7A5|nr:SAM-dependent methyltransferase [Ottowia sp. SB7-C50]WOP16609.1 SAM-dependent methyltransferase [Ottowia sp. SB7-C50]